MTLTASLRSKWTIEGQSLVFVGVLTYITGVPVSPGFTRRAPGSTASIPEL